MNLYSIYIGLHMPIHIQQSWMENIYTIFIEQNDQIE